MRATRIAPIVGIIVLLLVAGYLALYSNGLSQAPGSSSTSSSTASASTTQNSTTPETSANSSWTVIDSNTTIYGNPACIPVELFALSCPPVYPEAHSPSLSSVDVISYQGQELYDMNFTYGLDGQPVTHTVWFTNSTVFCVSPVFDGYELCPTHPVEPALVVVTTSAPSASALDPTNGLRLDLQLSTNSSGGIYVKVDEYNTLGVVNNVTSANGWATPAGQLRDICDNYVAAYAVYQGDYGAGNFTTASALVLDSPGAGNICPAAPPSAVYSFSPDSGVASAQAGVFSPVPTSENVTLSDHVSGFYTCGSSAPTFNNQSGSGLWTCGTGASSFNPFLRGPTPWSRSTSGATWRCCTLPSRPETVQSGQNGFRSSPSSRAGTRRRSGRIRPPSRRPQRPRRSM